MKILGINGSHRPNGATMNLTRKALEGAHSAGAETELVMLSELEIRYCTNCLKCYSDIESDIAPCSIDDGVGKVLEKIRDADGIILSSPVHNGFVTGLMTTFMERIAWRLCRPTGEILGLRGIPAPRLTEKTRAVATIVSAGCMPTKLRKFCDTGTPWLKEQGAICFNGECVADMYAGVVLDRELEKDEWARIYFIRKLSEKQLQEAFGIGVKMVDAIKNHRIRPANLSGMVGIFSDTAARVLSKIINPYEIKKS
ncbi:MAG: flavodoxin family protein [Candidatus Eremiobacteraeota bacterium]|nr:flavodoxin family protein [Candidatus Eremiobacteraeota bacterium]